MDINHDKRPFSLLFSDSFSLLNAELKDKQLTKAHT
jgi:hypothetical protein